MVGAPDRDVLIDATYGNRTPDADGNTHVARRNGLPVISTPPRRYVGRHRKRTRCNGWCK